MTTLLIMTTTTTTKTNKTKIWHKGWDLGLVPLFKFQLYRRRVWVSDPQNCQNLEFFAINLPIRGISVVQLLKLFARQ